MNSIEGNSLFNFVSSLGWVLDRTGEEEQIISTVWLTGDRQVATCAIPLIPYAETLEALIIRFPCTQKVWGVKSIDIHPGCDRWMAKRAYAQSLFFPPQWAYQPTAQCGNATFDAKYHAARQKRARPATPPNL